MKTIKNNQTRPRFIITTADSEYVPLGFPRKLGSFSVASPFGWQPQLSILFSTLEASCQLSFANKTYHLLTNVQSICKQKHIICEQKHNTCEQQHIICAQIILFLTHTDDLRAKHITCKQKHITCEQSMPYASM